MPYKVKKITQVDTSSLDTLGKSVTDLSKYTEDEFGSLARSLQATEARQVLFVAPPKPRTGLIVYADGTHWNPGSGEGAYFYKSTATWVPMWGTGGTGGGITDAPSDSTTYARKNATWVNVLNLADGGTVTGNTTFTGVVAVPTPTSASQVANKGYVDGLAGSVTPAMDGAALVGTSTHWAHEDHVHPTDTSRAPLASPTFTGVPAAPTAAVDTNTTQLATTAFVIGQLSAVGDGTPAMDGTAARGVSTHGARADHVHPTDTSRAPVASPTFTGVPAAPTATTGTNTTQLATCQFVISEVGALIAPATVAPLMDGTAAVGTSLLYARQDHVHPSDTTKANLASPTFTGVPAAPTATALTNNTQIATTAYADAAVGVEKTRALAAEALLAPLASPTFTGVPAGPTAAVNTNTTQLATTAFVVGQAGTANPLMDGTVAVGTSLLYARQDHVHPSDTSRAPVLNPTFSGTTTISGDLCLTGITTPPAMTTNTNDYGPAALSSSTILRISSTVAVDLTGIISQTNGTILVLDNIGSQVITLRNQSASSLAANRFLIGADIPLTANQGILLWYDSTSTAWRLGAGAGSGGGGASVSIQDTAPAGVLAGSLWWQSSTGTLYIYYNDGTSQQWVAASPLVEQVAAVQYDTSQALTATQQDQAQKNIGLPSILRGYLWGGTITPSASTTFTVSPCVSCDSTGADFMSTSVVFTKSTAAWSGGNAGGLDTGSITLNGWYAVYQIKRPDTGQVDFCFSTSASAPTFGVNIPAAFTIFRRIGFVRIAGGSAVFVPYTQNGNEFLWLNVVSDSAAFTPPDTLGHLMTLSVPTGAEVWALIHGQCLQGSGNDSRMYFSAPDKADEAAGGIYTNAGGFGSSSTNLSYTYDLSIRTNTSAQIRYRVVNATMQLYLGTRGWIDTRGTLN